MTLTPGMKLFYVSGRSHIGSHEVTVERVGRKWAYLAGPYGLRDDFRIDIDTLQIDRRGPFSLGRVYASREEWEAINARRKMWERFRGNVPFHPPTGVGTDDIRKAAALLGIDLGEPPATEGGQ